MAKNIVRVQDIPCGADPLFLISGPCVIEDEKTMFTTAERLKVVSEKLGLKVIFKSSFQKDNRSSTKNYEGPGLKDGLAMLRKIKEQFGFPLLSDVHYPDQVGPAAEVLDIIQIPAYLCMQTTLVVAAARTGKCVNIKHGQFLAPDNMKYPTQKVLDQGNHNIILTERGFTFGYNDLVVDPRAFHFMRELGFPVVFDVTHAIRKYGIPSADPRGGAREFLGVLARAGVAAGIDGLFVEAHPEPARALCDAASQLPLEHLEDFLAPLIELHQVEVKHRKRA